jgi:hypothetical protein
MIRDLIVSKALFYIGEQEVKGNQGFKNKIFENKMISVGFQHGFAWCALFGELVWREAGQDVNTSLDHILAKTFSAGAVKTFNNFKARKDFEISNTPTPGDLVVWQSYKRGKASWTGHLAIVVGVEDDHFETVEGNTNSKGGREGIEVALKKRNYNFQTTNGLRILGFIKPNDHAVEIRA